MKNLNIFGINYEIHLVNVDQLMKKYPEGSTRLDQLKELLGEDCSRFAGLCDSTSCKIYINKEMALEKIEKTLIHEIVEAIDQEALLDLEHVKIQAIVNALFMMNSIVNVKELLKDEPEEISISVN